MKKKDWEVAYISYINLLDNVRTLEPKVKYAKMKKRLVLSQLEKVRKELQFVLMYERLKT